MSSRTPGYEEEITLGISRIPTHNSKGGPANGAKQSFKVEARFAKGEQASRNGGVLGASGAAHKQPKFHNSYQTKFGKFDHGRNSQLSGLSVGVVSTYSQN